MNLEEVDQASAAGTKRESSNKKQKVYFTRKDCQGDMMNHVSTEVGKSLQEILDSRLRGNDNDLKVQTK